MMFAKRRTVGITVSLSLITATFAAAQDYDLSWYTIDGGGEMFTTGGDYELSGTIGQPDAGELSGGSFQLTGGFWFSLGEALVLVTSVPPDNAIDARQPSQPDGTEETGWNAITLTFSGDASGLTPDDFTVMTSPPGAAPEIVDVTVTGTTATVQFGDFIPLEAWTILTHNDSGGSVRIGYLPADVSNDRLSNANDVLALINALNEVGDPLAAYQTDVDRSGVANANDILRTIDLLNGAGEYDVYLGATLPE